MTTRYATNALRGLAGVAVALAVLLLPSCGTDTLTAPDAATSSAGICYLIRGQIYCIP